ncbi:MAG TPA: hypothetical protein VM452_09025 [Caulifigura sp.]|nr:hypothetical protein [Caulifigura sp.]
MNIGEPQKSASARLNGFVFGGSQRLASARYAIEYERVRQQFAERVQGASWWQRWWIEYRIDRQVRRLVARSAPSPETLW